MNRDDVVKIARVGYESYCKHTNWKSAVTGASLPQWDSLPEGVTSAWIAAAEGMINYTIDRIVELVEGKLCA